METIHRFCGLALLSCVASATYAGDVSFSYADPTVYGLSATFTLDVVNGLAQSGSGTASSSVFGTDNLVLVTASTVLPVGDGSINPIGPGSVYTWHGVPNTGGVDFSPDAVVNSTAPYFDSTNGLAFELVNPNTNAIVGGLWLIADHDASDTPYQSIIGANGGCYGPCDGGISTGSLTATPVPLPAALPLLLSALGGMGLVGRRRRVENMTN